MTKYAREWRTIVAQVWDSTGKTWKSKKLRKSDKPTWAKLQAVTTSNESLQTDRLTATAELKSLGFIKLPAHAAMETNA